MDKSLIKSRAAYCCRTGLIIILTIRMTAVQASLPACTDTVRPMQRTTNVDVLQFDSISIEGDRLTLKDLKDTIEAYTRYVVIIDKKILETGHTVQMHFRKISLRAALNYAIRGRRWMIELEGRTIAIKRDLSKLHLVKVIVRGRDDKGLPKATIETEDHHGLGITDENGYKTVTMPKGVDVIVVSYVSAPPVRVEVSDLDSIVVKMDSVQSTLGEVKVTGAPSPWRPIRPREPSGNHGPFNIGSTGTAQSLLSAQGLGALAIPQSGVPGSTISILVRGRNALEGDTPPLYVIDGVPFVSQSMANAAKGNSGGEVGLSPLAFLAGAIISSVRILKDPDSLAPYGARGVNGVIIINTIRTQENSRLFINFNTGCGMPSRNIHLMDTKQYLAMRREALGNDGITPDVFNAPDLLSWDTTHNVDWTKFIFKDAAKLTNASISNSWNWKHFSLLGSAAYLQEAEILSSHPVNYLGTLYGSAGYMPCDKLEMHITIIYSNNTNNQYGLNEATLQFYVPNVPPSLDSMQRLIYAGNNPLAFSQYKYSAHTQTIVGNFALTYKLGKLSLMLNGGYTGVDTKEGTIIPKDAQNPNSNPADLMYKAESIWNGKMMEAQLLYEWKWGKWNLSLTGGLNWYLQRSRITAPEDTVSAGTPISSLTSRITDDRNASAYLRWGANLDKKLYLDATVIRNVSSRMTPGHAVFYSAAAGTTWTYFQSTHEPDKKEFFYKGKVHVTYGIAASDALPEYSYQVTWSTIPGSIPGQLAGAVYPSVPADSSLDWMRIQKLSIGTTMDLYGGLVSVGVTYYNNLCKDLLVPRTLPSTTGFSTELSNWAASVRNTGWEIFLAKQARKGEKSTWTSMLTLTFPRDRLTSFYDLDNSYYKNRFLLHQPLEIVKLYLFTGVNEKTGLYTFKDLDGDGSVTEADRVIRRPGISMYGGWTNNVQIGPWQLDATLEFMIQTGFDYLREIFLNSPPGSLGTDLFSNVPTRLLDRWQKPGDHASFQRLTTQEGSDAGQALQMFINSTGMLHDASFLRLRQLTLSYSLPTRWLHKMKLNMEGKMYLQMQNLVTVTSYPEVDPMLQSGLVCPLVKSIAIGIQMHLK